MPAREPPGSRVPGVEVFVDPSGTAGGGADDGEALRPGRGPRGRPLGQQPAPVEHVVDGARLGVPVLRQPARGRVAARLEVADERTPVDALSGKSPAVARHPGEDSQPVPAHGAELRARGGRRRDALERRLHPGLQLGGVAHVAHLVDVRVPDQARRGREVEQRARAGQVLLPRMPIGEALDRGRGARLGVRPCLHVADQGELAGGVVPREVGRPDVDEAALVAGQPPGDQTGRRTGRLELAPREGGEAPLGRDIAASHGRRRVVAGCPLRTLGEGDEVGQRHRLRDRADAAVPHLLAVLHQPALRDPALHESAWPSCARCRDSGPSHPGRTGRRPDSGSWPTRGTPRIAPPTRRASTSALPARAQARHRGGGGIKHGGRHRRRARWEGGQTRRAYRDRQAGAKPFPPHRY